MERVFKIKEEGFQSIKGGMMKRSIPLIIIVAVVGCSIVFGNSIEEERDLTSLFIIIPLLGVIMVYAFNRGINRQKELFESYRLTITDYTISRVQKNTPDITIAHSDIRNITKHANGSISIQGDDPADLIGVPAQLEDFEALEKILFEFKPNSEPVEVGYIEKYQKVLPFFTVAMMGAVFISMDKIIVGACGTVLLGVFAYSINIIRNSKNIDSKTKNSMWLLIFVIISILATMYYKLTLPTI